MRWMVFASFLVLALAGCLGGGSDDTTDDSMENDTDDTGETMVPPLNVTLTASQSAGFAPLDLNLTLDADLDENTTALWRIDVFLLDALADENGTDNTTANVTLEPVQTFEGSDLPALVNLTLEVGTYSVEAFVDADPLGNGTATVEILVEEVPVIVLPVLFEDGAENGTDQWTIVSRPYLGDTESPLPIPYPETAWAPSVDEAFAGSNSWFSQYPDGYISRMTSAEIEVPADGNVHTLSFRIKGASEEGVDELIASVGPSDALRDISTFSTQIEDWKLVKAPVKAGQTVVIQFQFSADEGCSALTQPPAGCGSGPFIGWYIDDIELR